MKKKNKQTNRQTKTNKQTNGKSTTKEQTNKQTNEQTNKQTNRTFSAPSAMSRSLLHVPQNCCDIDVMKPTRPAKPGALGVRHRLMRAKRKRKETKQASNKTRYITEKRDEKIGPKLK
jgi:hypothetical protein